MVRTSTGGSTASVDSSSAGSYRPLNVRDALTYLDDVKEQFKNEPTIYHKFLDVMKEFKMNEISTPGVIERVATLFRGHPNLIVGFNTFLPPGFRIEINSDQAGSYTITTPESSMQINHFQPPPGPPRDAPVPMQQSNGPPAGNSFSLQQQQPQPAANQRRTPVEFNHAINYVNKIKNRFTNDPETYRQFLEILRTYQNESKPIPEVYAQIQVLFKNSSDLLDEFKQFLPDTSAEQHAPPAGSFQPPPFQPVPVRPQGKSQGGRPKKTPSAAHNRVRFDQQMRIYAGEEFDFFERVKKVLANKTTYAEFLKVLNLFNQDIIDPQMLIEKVEPFLERSPELFDWFKNYVRAEDKEFQPIVRSETPPRDLADAKRSGSSYRLLPSDYVQAPCAGRDALCESVLNDSWVCHPTWASEDGGFVAHKKNLFEEAMYRTEEERYEFDLFIEANKCVIQRLELTAKKIAEMSPDEQAQYKLPEGLGDSMSVSVYRKAIKKIYDNERGEEVIESLHEHPAVAVPIVLKRLKQKDEEWRRSQREWNKVWREIDAKNFYKSLDHQGINFKNNDKKSLMSKTLIQEAETLYRERREKPNKSLPKHHLSLKVDDADIQRDIVQLMLSYLEKASQFSAEDITRVEEFVKKLLSSMNIVSAKALADKQESEDSMQVDDLVPVPKKCLLYGNSSYYLFFRLYQIAYSRLFTFRELSRDIASVRVGYSRLKQQQLASSLDLVSKKDPVTTEVPNDDVYTCALEVIEKFFENEIEQTLFEDQLRFWFGSSAYILYTVDKLFHSLCKQIVHIVSEPRCMKLFSLFEKFSVHAPATTPQILLQYRQKANELVDEEENVYRIEYDQPSKSILIELLGEDATNGDVGQNELKWTEYIENYVKMPVSGNMNTFLKNPVFLKRSCLKPKDGMTYEAVNNMECKICVNTYKMFFVENSEDFFRKFVDKKHGELGKSIYEKRMHKFEAWLNSPRSGWANGLNDQEKKSNQEKCNTFLTHAKIPGAKNSTAKFKTVKEKTSLAGQTCVRYKTTFSGAASPLKQQ